MDDPQPVRLVDGAGQRLDQPGRVAGRPGGAVEAVGQAAPGDVLQREVRAAVVVAEGVDLDDVRVVQPGDGLGLGQEADGRLGPGVVAGQDHLQGDEAVEPDLAGLVDDAHAAAAQLAEDLVAGDAPGGPPRSRWAGQFGVSLPATLPVIVARATCSGSSARYLGKRREVFVEWGVGLAAPA